jgi:hypothetical protein
MTPTQHRLARLARCFIAGIKEGAPAGLALLAAAALLHALPAEWGAAAGTWTREALGLPPLPARPD